jgi:hypothetical protein
VGNILKDIRVELIPRTQVLHQDQERPKRKRSKRINEATLERNRGDESTAKSTDNDCYPSLIEHLNNVISTLNEMEQEK